MINRYKIWRVALVILCSAFFVNIGAAQQRVSAYRATNFSGTFNSIASTGTVLDFYGNIWFSGYASFSMPFDFTYDNQTIAAGTEIGLSGGGAIDMGGGHPSYGSGQGDSYYPRLLSFLGGYIITGDEANGDNNNYYLTTGTAPNRVLTIEARRIHFVGAGGGTGTGGAAKQISVQVKLYEATGNIEFLYSRHSFNMGTYYYGDGCQIGINGFASPSFEYNTVTDATTSTPASDIRFNAQPLPQLALSPESMNFGSVSSGNTVTLCATLSNAAISGTLHLQDISVVGNPDFQIISAPAIGSTYTTGQSAQICVQFSPLVIGTRTAVLRVTTDGADSGTQLVTLTGVVIAPGIEMPVTDIFRKTRVRLGRSATVAIPVHSIGQGPLVITSTSITGLNADNYSVVSLPPAIPVGAWDSIYIRFTPKFEGRAEATIVVNSNGLNNPRITVQAYGVGILPRLALTPSTLNFDSVYVGQQICTAVKLSNPGTDTVAVTRELKTGGDYDFTFTPLTSADSLIAPGQERSFMVCFTPLRNGLRVATIRFFTDVPLTIPDGRDTSQITLNITGTGVPFGQLQFTSDFVDTAIVGVENCVTQTVRNVGSADITITSARIIGRDSSEFSYSGLTLPMTIAAGTSVSVTYCLTPTMRGDRIASLVLTGSNSGSPATMTLPLGGFGIEVCASSSPTSAFGTMTNVGRSDTVTITVTNCGELATTYTAALPSGTTKYTIVGPATSGTIAPNGTATFQVAYTPTAIGTDASTLTVTGGLGVVPMSIRLGGTGAGVIAAASNADAGNVAKGECHDFTVTITNNGNVDWTPGTATIGGTNRNDFTFVSLSPTTIPAGGTGTLTLRFCPSTTTNESATVSFDASSPAPLAPFSIALSGTGQVNAVSEVTELNGFALGQNYPNPMQRTSDVVVTVPHESLVVMQLVDLTGNVVRTIANERMSSGFHTVTIDAGTLPSGTYYYVLTSGETRLTRQLVLTK